jgi:NADH-quinone oxidoreductase subunit L
VAAAKKAFVMNAIGDATFALAIVLLIWNADGQVGLLEVFSIVEGGNSAISNDTVINLVALGLLGGAVAKSAQLPLQTWLPDAMEGPTPVSALIHAATMVTAGVYLIVRTNPLFELAPKVQDLAAGLGAATILLAGLIALVQTDIKRVIAYSTMSQIGYMFLGVGIGAYANGMFHLMTHAFFKALLFMAAGIVIHALAGEQDIRRMGGLRVLMPWTAVAFWIGGLALVGIPPFAGFFSKDSILAAALDHGWYGAVLWIVGLVGAFLTGLYTFRMLFIVFGGEQPDFVREHPPHLHGDAPARYSLGIPVAILAGLSLIGGWIQFADLWTPITDWLRPVAEPLVEPTGFQEATTSSLAVILGALGIVMAWGYYGARMFTVPAAPRIRRVLEHKFYFDELYDALFYKPAVVTARILTALVEGPLVGGSVTGVAAAVRGLGTRTTRLQTGLVRSYVLALATSLAVLAFVFVLVR